MGQDAESILVFHVLIGDVSSYFSFIATVYISLRWYQATIPIGAQTIISFLNFVIDSYRTCIMNSLEPSYCFSFRPMTVDVTSIIMLLPFFILLQTSPNEHTLEPRETIKTSKPWSDHLFIHRKH